jgi:hypothetical protein
MPSAAQKTRTEKKLLKGFLGNITLRLKQERVILHRERKQPPVDEAGDGPTSRAAESPAGCRRFPFVLRFVFCFVFSIAAPFA